MDKNKETSVKVRALCGVGFWSMAVSISLLPVAVGCDGTDGGPADSGSDGDSDGDSDTDHTFDGGPDSGQLDVCFDGIEPKGNGLGFVQIQDLVDEAQTMRLRLATEPGDRDAIGETFPYDLVRFGIASNGVTQCVVSGKSLSYDFGHHNWDELATAKTDDAVYEVKMQFMTFETGWEDTLVIYELDGKTVRNGPIALNEAGCRSIPYNPNPCMGRDRTDD